jgi:hypothetical protein
MKYKTKQKVANCECCIPEYISHITYRFGNLNILNSVGSEVLTAVVMNISVFLDIAQCSPYLNRRFRGTCHLCLRDRKSTKQKINVQPVTRQNSEDGDEILLRNPNHIWSRRRAILKDRNIQPEQSPSFSLSPGHRRHDVDLQCGAGDMLRC